MDPPPPPPHRGPSIHSSPTHPVTLPIDSMGRLMEPSSVRCLGSGHDVGGAGTIGDLHGTRPVDHHSTPMYPPHPCPWEANDIPHISRSATEVRHLPPRHWERSFPPIESTMPVEDRHASYSSRSHDFSPNGMPDHGSMAASYPGGSHGLLASPAAPLHQQSPPAPHSINHQSVLPPLNHYEPASTSYGHPVRAPSDLNMNASGHLRPGSVPWNYAYPPAGPTRPPTGDHYTDPYAQRTVDSSLPSIPPPFRGPHDGYDAGFGRDGVEYTSSLSPVESSRPHLPGLDHRTRRTSLEGGSSMRKAAMPTSRLGLDPVAKQERRREQNRLAQRAFRARAKMREQGKNNEEAE